MSSAFVGVTDALLLGLSFFSFLRRSGEDEDEEEDEGEGDRFLFVAAFFFFLGEVERERGLVSR